MGSQGDGEDAMDNWAQCERCGKWRRLPQGAVVPDEDAAWYCEANEDPQFNSCELDEEEWEEDEARVTSDE